MLIWTTRPRRQVFEGRAILRLICVGGWQNRLSRSCRFSKLYGGRALEAISSAYCSLDPAVYRFPLASLQRPGRRLQQPFGITRARICCNLSHCIRHRRSSSLPGLRNTKQASRGEEHQPALLCQRGCCRSDAPFPAGLADHNWYRIGCVHCSSKFLCTLAADTTVPVLV